MAIAENPVPQYSGQDYLDMVMHLRPAQNPQTGKQDYILESANRDIRSFYPAKTEEGKDCFVSRILPPHLAEDILDSYDLVSRTGKSRTELFAWVRGLQGRAAAQSPQPEWVEQHIIKSFDEKILVVIRDVTEIRRQQLIYESRWRTLEQLATGDSLSGVLETLALTTEKIFPGMTCTVLIYDAQANRISHVTAPRMPEIYAETVKGLDMGPTVGTSGPAICGRKRVVTTNLPGDPNWAPFLHLSETMRLRSCWAQPIFSRDNRVLGVLCLYSGDVTEPSAAKIRVIEHAAHLAGLAISHSQAEYKMLEVLEEARKANLAKTEFLANMSHELRTPLNAILGFSEVMKEKIFGDLNPTYQDYAEKIHNSGQMLLSLISDLLDVSRIEQGKFRIEKETVLIDELVKEAVRMTEEWAGDQGVTLTVRGIACDCQIHADRRAMKQVLINLISNAVKFSNKGDTVTISCRIGEEGGAHIKVQDTGIGIAPDHLSRIIKPFHQVANSYSRDYQGVGLGLYIVSEIVRLHGGQLKIDSAVGDGTTVRVFLPRLAKV